MTTWKLVGESTFKREERDQACYRLVGDVSALTVPLSWPIAKPLERYLIYNDASKILLLWQTLAAQCEFPERPSYVAFPADDVEMAGYYTQPDGEPVDRFPWQPDPAAPDTTPEDRPENWAALIATWYMDQVWFGQRALVTAFGEAMEALTGLPLERCAPLLHFWLTIELSGEDVSVSKPASTSTKRTTARKSGPRRTTSSPAA